MSSSRLRTKNFEVCHSLQNITPPICRVIGSSDV